MGKVVRRLLSFLLPVLAVTVLACGAGNVVSKSAEKENKELFEAVKSNNVVRLKQLLAEGADANSVNSDGSTPLGEAASMGRIEIAELLLKSGAKVDLPSKQDGPLHFALMNMTTRQDSFSRRYGMVKLLVDYGADINAAGDCGAPINEALVNRPVHPDIVKLLLDKGANVNSRLEGSGLYRAFSGKTPLHQVVSPPQEDVAEILLSRGANVNAKDKDGLTPLALARKYEKSNTHFNYKNVIDLLIRYGGHE